LYLAADTTTVVVDSGNANPDYQFRYDAKLGGYIFNLSTRGLAPGRYGLTFYVGTERSFFYSVAFQVK
jgi:hypothetical protein